MTTQLAALASALDIGTGRFFDPSTTEARQVLDRAGMRLELSLAHTVVALAGATGSGKSTLFNRVSGMDIARVGVRRPTTAQPLACVWGIEGAQPLLDWLEVPDLNRVSRESALEPGVPGGLHGLVLLDLPDHDSTQVAHRQTVDRMVELVDLFVWVMDPQKYADAAVHERYLQTLSAHGAVTVVVLNQADRLGPEDQEACVADLRRLLDDDGLPAAPILPMSAVTGEGVDALVERLRETVAERQAIRERVEADARRVARRMEDVLNGAEPGKIGAAERDGLVAALVAAGGIDGLAEAAGQAYLRPGRRNGPPPQLEVDRDAAEAAVRELGETAVGSLTGGWGGAVRATVEEAARAAPDSLRAGLAAADLDGGRGGWWWRLSGALEWLALLAGIAGGVWAAFLEVARRAGLEWFDRMDLPQPDAERTTLPMMLLVIGGGVWLVIAVVRRLTARRARRHRAEHVRGELRQVVAGVADEVIRPIRGEIDRYRTFRAALADASA